LHLSRELGIIRFSSLITQVPENKMQRLPTFRVLFAFFFGGILLLSGCQNWRGQRTTDETQVDTTLASAVPASAPQVVPDAPQKGFEQEAPKAQIL